MILYFFYLVFESKIGLKEPKNRSKFFIKIGSYFKKKIRSLKISTILLFSSLNMKRYFWPFFIFTCLLVLSFSFFHAHSARKNSHSKLKKRSALADLPSYKNFCRSVVLDEAKFTSFRRDPLFALFHDFHTEEEGSDFFIEIVSKYPHLLFKLEQFRQSDMIGSPQVFNYPFIGAFSPTTLGYVKTAGEIEKLVGSWENLHIVEIGGGYGGLCKILSDLHPFASYTIVDLPENLELSKRYLEKLGIKNVKFCSLQEVYSHKITYDLVVSYYGLSQFDRDIQRKLIKSICRQARSGYLACHFHPKHYGVKSLPNMQFAKILKRIQPDVKELPEEPLLLKGNRLFIWHPKNPIFPLLPKEKDVL